MKEAIERRIAIGSIFSKRYVERIIHRMDTSLLRSKEVRVVVNFAFSVFRKTGNIIGDEIATHIDLHLPDSDERKEIIFSFLASIDDAEKQVNDDILFYDTVDYLAQRKIEILTQHLQNALDRADINTARKILSGFTVPSNIETEEDEIFSREAVEEIFSYAEPLIKFEGKLGRMINKFLTRGSFFAIMAPEKRGKSWFLIEFAMRALKSGLKVVYFEAGDNSLNQIRKRFLMYMLQRPFFVKHDMMLPEFDCEANHGDCSLPFRKNVVKPIQIDGKIDFVQSIENGYRPCAECMYRKKPFPITSFLMPADSKHLKPITKEDAIYVAENFDSIIKKYGGDLKLFTFPSNTLSASAISEILNEQKTVNNWIPDIVIIDYADILATEGGGSEYRHRINDTWLKLRKISLEWDVLLITATQSDVQGHKSRILDQLRFSEDKRKLAHTTAMIGLNQDAHEKKIGLMRVNVIVAREDEFDVNEVAYILTAPQIGRIIYKIEE